MIGDYCQGCKTLVITSRSQRCPWCDSIVDPPVEAFPTMLRALEVTTLLHLTHPFKYEEIAR